MSSEIRLALGATARQTIAGVDEARSSAVARGIAMGLALSSGACVDARSRFGVREDDPVTFIATTLLLLAVAALASLARRCAFCV